MKSKITTIGFTAYLIAIVVLISMSLTSCASGSGYQKCAAYSCVELEITAE